jgi:hypothetical protein
MDKLPKCAKPKSVNQGLSKAIFIGSSSGDIALALEVSNKLKTDTVIPKCWTEEFPLGLLTFEALERMLRMCAGAVFIVAGDQGGHLNNNVMIELGLVAGRMGRTRVALCTSGKVNLPSDLDALTRIENILALPKDKTSATLSDAAVKQLANWAASLPVTPENIPCTEVLHGYTGRWKVVLKFTTWRTREINSQDIAGLNGEIILHVPPDGIAGFGVLSGKVTLHWKECPKRKKAYMGIFHVCACITGVISRPDGSMTLRTQTFMRQAVLEKGPSSPEDVLPEDLAMPWIFRWDLRPLKSEPGLMGIKVKTELPNDWTSGEGCAYKEA